MCHIRAGVRCENGVNEWPGTNLHKDFAICWTGRIRIDKDGDYKFYRAADSGLSLYVDGKLVVNNGSMHGIDWEGRGAKHEGGRSDFKEEFYFAGGVPACVASWQPPGGDKAVIPESALFHQEAPNGGSSRA